MSKSTNRRGLALGAIFALFASLFSAVPAQAAPADNGASISIRPEAGTSFTSLLVEDFSIYAQLNSGVTNENFSAGNVYWEITKTGNLDVIMTASNTAAVSGLPSGATPSSIGVSTLFAGSTSMTVSASVSGTLGTLNGLTFRAYTASGIVSSSPAVTLTVRVFIDDQGIPNETYDVGEWHTTQVITLHPTSAVSSTMTITQPLEGDTVVTVSALVNTALNFDQLPGRFFLAMSSSDTIYTGPASVLKGDLKTGAQVKAGAGVVSQSFTVASPLSDLSASMTVSAALRYTTGTSAADIYAGSLIGSVQNKVATAASTDTLYTQVVASNHVTMSAGTVAVRPNQTYTVRVGASTGSSSVSGAVISVAFSGAALSLPNKTISINGAAATTSYPTAMSVTTGANGFATFTLTTFGFVAGNQVAMVASQGNTATSTLTLVATAPVYTVVNDYDLYSTTPGTAVTIGFSVEDQWQVKSSRTDQRIQVTRGGTGFNYGTATVSEIAVVGGEGSFSFTPAPAAKTGSAKVNTALQVYNQDTANWDAGGNAGAEITVDVTSTSALFSTASAVLSKSASISYSVSDGVFVWTDTVTVTGTGAGVDVAVSAPGLFIQNTATDATASGAITARTNGSKQVGFKFASNIAGTYTVTYVLAGNSTTSTIVISPAASTSGKAISFDTTSIGSGSTKTITGTLVDMFGNPVLTTGSATILVTYVGTGIVVGSMPTETNADGEFAFSVLVGSNDSGTALVTASYYKAGADTLAADVLTATQQITIGGSATTAPASDQKLTVGSFKGFVAIYALNYTGQKLSAKVAGKWLVVNELTRFQRVVRNTGAGYTIKVDLHIDGVFVRSETVVTK
jgi:trimeric autotransporter adhesin